VLKKYTKNSLESSEIHHVRKKTTLIYDINI
jgi:hypothetical protein